MDLCMIGNASKLIAKILHPFQNPDLAAAVARARSVFQISISIVRANGNTAADEVPVSRAGGRGHIVVADHREHVYVGEAVRG